jgi:hypothetical protein
MFDRDLGIDRLRRRLLTLRELEAYKEELSFNRRVLNLKRL